MRLAPSLAFMTLAGLAACGQPADKPSATPPADVPQSRMLGGVDLDQPFRVSGTEPFYAVDATPQGFVYSGVDRPEQTATNPGPTLAGTTASFTTTTSQNLALIITLVATQCSDGMSDRVYPLTAQVVIGSEKLNGCADAASNFPAATPTEEAPGEAPVPVLAPAPEG